MDLEKLQEQADNDLKINDSELDLESLKTPQLHNKYLKHLTKFKLMLSRAEGNLYNTKRELWEYYTGKSDASVYAQKPFNFKLLRQDVDQYIQSADCIYWSTSCLNNLKLNGFCAYTEASDLPV